MGEHKLVLCMAAPGCCVRFAGRGLTMRLGAGCLVFGARRPVGQGPGRLGRLGRDVWAVLVLVLVRSQEVTASGFRRKDFPASRLGGLDSEPWTVDCGL